MRDDKLTRQHDSVRAGLNGKGARYDGKYGPFLCGYSLAVLMFMALRNR